jgi:hypothetical protein
VRSRDGESEKGGGFRHGAKVSQGLRAQPFEFRYAADFADVVDALVDRFGDGVSGSWRVPGEFGNRVAVTKGNTTLFASDRDMFVFLADEENRIELPNRRAGRMGSFARLGAELYGVAVDEIDRIIRRPS